MGTPYKMKGSPMQRNFSIGSPVKQDILQKISEGFSKNKHNYGKTTKVSTTTPKGTSYVETSNVTGRVVREGGGDGSKGTRRNKATGNKLGQSTFPNNPDLTKRSYDIKVKGKGKGKAIKKAGKTIIKKALGKLVPAIAVADAAHSLYKTKRKGWSGVKEFGSRFLTGGPDLFGK